MFPLSISGFGDKFQDKMHGFVITPLVVLLSVVSLLLFIIGGFLKLRYLSLAICASITFFFMIFGAIGSGAFPKRFFGVFERFTVFSV